ncbi:hypothetical protein RRG08_048644 [Elysia crispata]|uniref:Uncharacterized protein n=1 Tax=Elysia crispata TaxID=231223 RepID=A0AAE1ACQ3_9GAST|nr:hypothetical protein RRG08_048644 [Elysia crispata]
MSRFNLIEIRATRLYSGYKRRQRLICATVLRNALHTLDVKMDENYADRQKIVIAEHHKELLLTYLMVMSKVYCQVRGNWTVQFETPGWTFPTRQRPPETALFYSGQWETVSN